MARPTINPLPPRPAPRPSAGRAPVRRPPSFRRVFLWVAALHLLLILAMAFLRFPTLKSAKGDPGQPMNFIPLPPSEIPPPAGSAPTQPQPAPAAAPEPTPPAPTPPPTPTPPAPTPPAPEPTPAPTPDPTPVAPPAPSEIVVPPKPTPAKPEKPQPQPAKPAPTPAAETAPPAKPTPAKEKHTPKINLTETTRSSSAAPATTEKPAHTAPKASGEGQGPALQPSGVANALSKALEGAGVTPRISISGGGPGGNNGNHGDSAYYALIQKAMYGAWDQPLELAGQHLAARIQIHIATDGTVSGATLVGSSGNGAFDQSALGAARRVARIEKPRPDDVPETIVVNFKLAE